MVEIANYYRQGSILSLKLDTGTAPATVMQPLTPFTSSQVLLILLDGVPTIMKVYDPRFLCHRQPSKHRPARPWDCQIEAEAIRQTTPDPNFDFSAYPGRNDRVGWEILYYQQMECTFRSEVESYMCLAPLQGHEIPCCYGSGHLILANRAFFPHILLLQYIPDAIDLRDIAVKPDRSIILSLFKTVSGFGALGVTHNDINPGNILFSPHNAPTHAVIIDFGHAYYRESESDQEWDEIVKENGDVRAFKRLLGWKGWGFENPA